MFILMSLCKNARGTITINGEKKVLQRTAYGLGNVSCDNTKRLQLRRWRKTPNPNTPKQQAVRQIFRDAISAYRVATAAEIESAKETGRKKQLPVYHSFISNYLKTHKP